eukprot:gnl/Chilomastix_caulleri/1582.p1 GENE.gnl/Chilomastix_caulleri/1582~~gnl/Chilomastix_caulleri/1582.p1  ORF type:complete len:82 (+),score=20.85 gnl/Chilomastix_caulleri/1582:125-370(+)
MELVEPILQNLSSYIDTPNFNSGSVAPGDAPLAAMVGVFLHSVNVLESLTRSVLSRKLVNGASFERALLIELRARRILALV